MGRRSMFSYLALFLACSLFSRALAEPLRHRRAAASNYLNSSSTTFVTEFSTIFETETITAPPRPTASNKNSCGGVTINGLDVNAYYWDSVHYITETTVYYETCTGDPNTIAGKPPPVATNTTANSSAPATIPIYLSLVESVTGSSTFTSILTEPGFTGSNNSTYPGLTTTETFTEDLITTLTPDPTDMVVTVSVPNGILTSATPVIVYSAVEIVSGSSNTANHRCDFSRTTTVLPFNIVDVLSPNATSSWIHSVKAPVSGLIAQNEQNMEAFSSALGTGNFTLGSYVGYPTVAVVSYFRTDIACVSPVQAVSSEVSLLLPTTSAAPVPNSPSPSPAASPSGVPRLTSASALVPSPSLSPYPAAESPKPSPNPPANSPSPAPGPSPSPNVETMTVVPEPAQASPPAIAPVIASMFGITAPSAQPRPSPAPSPGSPPANPAPPVITIGSNTITANSATAFTVGSQTLTPGGPAITISGTPISLAPSATAVVIGGSTSPIAQPVPAPAPTPAPVITVGGSTITANSATAFTIGSQTLTPNGVITVSGTPVSLSVGPSGTAIVVDGTTTPLAASPAATSAEPLLTIGNSVFTEDSASGFVIGSQTLVPGGPAVTVGGTIVSEEPGATGVVVGSNTVPLSVAPTAGAGGVPFEGRAGRVGVGAYLGIVVVAALGALM